VRRFDFGAKLRMVEQQFRLRVADDISDLFGFEQRIDRPGERADFEAGEISDDVFRAVRQEQAHRVAALHAVSRE
jgi:hypothetical protein